MGKINKGLQGKPVLFGFLRRFRLFSVAYPEMNDQLAVYASDFAFIMPAGAPLFASIRTRLIIS
jgi:hypothetical protein